MPNQGFPIKSGTFNLPAGLASRLASVTVTAQQANSGVVVTRPDGSELWSVAGLANGDSTTLSLVNGPALLPGTYTIVVTGKVTGQLNADT